ncbi:MAG: M55 family metallopeptidase [Deltaproteobacteria bacterium]|nr:M55 family metallopeptidase [Deltaproteobacteria bacterium]MBW2416041.1 M55 family metallopeptidase [Deltaproteobacteria bacterium]
MKVFISVDMEGISGLVRWADVASQGIDYPKNRSLLTLDTNAAIQGAFEAGATEVVVEENHGVEDLCNVVMDEVDSRCRVVRGAGRPEATTMAALDESVGVVLLVGHHARAGSFPGIMAHTVSYGGFRAVRVAGQDCGESEIFAIRAGEVGVPVGLVTGDQVVAEQLRKRAPWVEAVEVKRALSNVAGDVIPPVRAREAIRAGARRAVERAAGGELEPYRGEPAPYEIEVDLRNAPSDAMRANLARLPEFEIRGEKTVGTLAEDMSIGFRRIAYLGYADREGTTRY